MDKHSQFTALETQLMQLRSAGAEGFDAITLRLVESLLEKATAHQGPTQQVLIERIQRRLQDLQTRFQHARETARNQARTLREQHPERNEELVRLFRSGDFRAIDRLAHTPAPQPSPLTLLLQTLASHDPDLDASADPQTFDEVLRKQELEAQQGNGLYSLHSHLKTRVDSDELRSARQFRDHWAKRAIDRAITRALDEAPENAGPLNAHQLVIRALNTMGDIAPEYLNRFVSYVDTLLWLDQAARHFGVPDSRASRTKSGFNTHQG